MRVSILTRSLTRGGAQVQVVALAAGLARRGHEVSVVAFYGDGALAGQARAQGGKLVELRKSGRWSFLAPLRKLVQHLKSSQSDIVYSFLAMENLFGLAAARIAHKPIIWGVRGAGVDRGQYGLSSRVLYGMQFGLMRLADGVICNSQAAADEIPANKCRTLHVVPNGIDCEKFSPDTEGRRSWRSRFGFGDDSKVIGIVARLDPMKDHANFLRAAARVAEVNPACSFVIAGCGSPAYEKQLRELARQLRLDDRVLWLGEVGDTAQVYRGLDLLVSASAYGEGFSNSIGEAMACGVATVATDVGDSRIVLGEHGRIVPVRDPQALADGMLAVLAADDPLSRAVRREWIAGQFGVEIMVSRTEDILARTVALA